MHAFSQEDLHILISSFLEMDFEINISDKKSRRFDLFEVIFKCIKVLISTSERSKRRDFLSLIFISK